MWFGGVVVRKSPSTTHAYDYVVMLQSNQSTVRVKMPLDSYSTDEAVSVGAWVLLEVLPEQGVRRSERTLTRNVRNMDLSAY